MYTSMKDLHIRQMAARHEEHEVEDGLRELRAMRRSTALKAQVETLLQENKERRKRWRAYRYR